nr:uncharacterized protein LOC113819310 [Penaeus vannamei]
MKVYRLCESDGAGAGYTSAFMVYMGQDRGDVPASMKAVTELMNRACLFEKGYELYLDNWYSSPELFHYLSSRKTNVVGTRRRLPDFGDRDVGYVLDGSEEGAFAFDHQQPRHFDLPLNRDSIVRTKPQVVVDYVGKKGVDLTDQLAASYSTARRRNKWYKNVFYTC